MMGSPCAQHAGRSTAMRSVAVALLAASVLAALGGASAQAVGAPCSTSGTRGFPANLCGPDGGESEELECVIFDEGMPEVDLPNRGICQLRDSAKGGSNKGRVILSEIASPLNVRPSGSFIELFNPTDTEVDLGEEGYKILKMVFGASPQDSMPPSVALEGRQDERIISKELKGVVKARSAFVLCAGYKGQFDRAHGITIGKKSNLRVIDQTKQRCDFWVGEIANVMWDDAVILMKSSGQPGRVRAPCVCQEIYAPVCATTSQGELITYSNECHAKCDLGDRLAGLRMGECPAPDGSDVLRAVPDAKPESAVPGADEISGGEATDAVVDVYGGNVYLRPASDTIPGATQQPVPIPYMSWQHPWPEMLYGRAERVRFDPAGIPPSIGGTDAFDLSSILALFDASQWRICSLLDATGAVIEVDNGGAVASEQQKKCENRALVAPGDFDPGRWEPAR